MLNSPMDHIVLVHYRDITIGKHSAQPISTITFGSSNIIQTSNSYTLSPSPSQPYTTMSPPPTSITERIDASPHLQINQALRRLEEHLSLDDLQDIGILYSDNQAPTDLGLTTNDQSFSGSDGLQYASDDHVSLQYGGLFSFVFLITIKACAYTMWLVMYWVGSVG